MRRAASHFFLSKSALAEAEEAQDDQDEDDDEHDPQNRHLRFPSFRYSGVALKTANRPRGIRAQSPSAWSSRSAWSIPSRMRRTVPVTANAGTSASQKLKMR